MKSGRRFAGIFLLYLGIQCVFGLTDSCFAQQMEFVPDKMIPKGDVTTRKNSIGRCTNAWMTNMPDGSIILGVNPTSCNPNDWHGAAATVQFTVESKSFPIIGVLRISWPDRDGKGLHSPYRGKISIIKFDGDTIWSKRTEIIGSNNDFYAAEHECVQATVVLRDEGPHNFTFVIPEKTAWDISRVELLLYDYPRNMQGIGYSPYRDCQYPNDNGLQQPTIEEVKEDLLRLSHTCNTIRTYSSAGISGKIPAIAKSLGLRVYAGAWIDGGFDDSKHDSLELKALIDIADTVNVDGLIVGNEYYLRHRHEPDAIKYLQRCIIQVKEGIKKKTKPVTTAEIYPDVLSKRYQKIIDEIDGLIIHLYPFWAGHSIDGAVDVAMKQYREVRDFVDRQYPGENKFVIVGETGWPSNGENVGQAVANPENQRRYLHEFMNSADMEKVDYMYFDAFDELWKTREGLRGQHWGYSYSDRTAKYNFYGMLMPPYLISEDKVDLPPTVPVRKEIPNIYRILYEWPRSQESFKITDESIKRIGEQNVLGALPRALRKFLDREFTDETTFLDFVVTELRKTGVELQEKQAEIDNRNESGYSSHEVHSVIGDLIVRYSRYHYFFPRFMGDYDKINMYECDRCGPASGDMATGITFSFDGKQKWCGIYWLPSYDFENAKYPELRWEELPGVSIYEKMKIDRSLPVVLTFYARGEQGAERVQFKVGGINKNKPVETEWIALEKGWKKYVIDLSGQDLSNVIGGFCCVSNEDKNPGRETIHSYLDDVQYELKTENTPGPDNINLNMLESDYHLLQFFGDISSRSTNFFESNYRGGVFSGQTRFVFPRFSKFLDSAVPIPDPFFSGTLMGLKDIDWEDRFDYGVGLEWRPFSRANFLEEPILLWVKQLRFYTLFLGTKYLEYQSSWSWRPRTDFRYSLEFYSEYSLYNTDKIWAELWGDASWWKTNFYVKDYNSWTFAMVPKFGVKIFPERELSIMPYVTGEIALAQRNEFWQNRALLGGGIRLMPFRWNESAMDVFAKGLRVYVEGLWALRYFADKAPDFTPNYDLRTGINYTINWR